MVEDEALWVALKKEKESDSEARTKRLRRRTHVEKWFHLLEDALRIKVRADR